MVPVFSSYDIYYLVFQTAKGAKLYSAATAATVDAQLTGKEGEEKVKLHTHSYCCLDYAQVCLFPVYPIHIYFYKCCSSMIHVVFVLFCVLSCHYFWVSYQLNYGSRMCRNFYVEFCCRYMMWLGTESIAWRSCWKMNWTTRTQLKNISVQSVEKGLSNPL